MLVIVSDLHLTDGSSGETIPTGAFRCFRERLRDLAYDASWRADGKYRPIEELHVLLLGDILDVIRSEKWLTGEMRPWSDTDNSQFAATIKGITADILMNNKDSLDVLKSLHDVKRFTIPPAAADGGPARVSRDPSAAERVPVTVHIHYMIGNHDWFYRLPGDDYDKVRQNIVAAIGLANPSGVPFPYEAEESEQLARVLADHRVYARHGDFFDEFNYEGNRNASSLGDAIVVELLNRFPKKVADEMGGELPKDCLEGLMEIDNVRPLLLIPVWVDGLLRRTCADTDQVKQVKKIWDGLVDKFLELPFVRERDSVWNLFDNVDKLEWALKFSKGVSLRTIGQVMQWVYEKHGDVREKFYTNALTERAFKNRSARHIVYGHSHHHEIVPLDLWYGSGGISRHIYLNSSTWRCVHELARLNPKNQEFIGYKVMTYLAFFKDGERRGRSFESWSGALGNA